MCGFAGKVSLTGSHPPASRALLTRMIRAVEHRGPDAFGLYRDERAGLAHARLAIVDLLTGDQPMSDADESWWIVFNGEIFNHVELRRELEGLGHRFRTHSDTEVVVQAYQAWGTACFSRFNGQWALALWHNRRHELVLSRDPIGICPLFVHERNDAVWFASEMKGILADPEVPRALDPRGIDQTFTYWGSIAPITPFAGIEELRPGSHRVYRDGRRIDGVHWTPEYPPTVAPWKGSLEGATQQLRELLVQASQLRVSRADVPVGSYLSGGLDSSLIAMLGRDAHRGEFRTYSLRFDDAEFDEGPFQRLVAAQLGSRHDEVVVGRAAIAEVFPEVVRHAERPVLRTAAAPMHLLSREVRASGVKAVLTGEGADEMLAGYDLFREARIRAFWARRQESTVRPLLFDRIYPYLSRTSAQGKGMANAFWKVGLDRVGLPGFSHDPRWRSAAALKRFFSPSFAEAVATARTPDHLASLPDAFRSWHSLSQAQYLEITTLLSPYIISSQGDRQLLANGVEGRFPFLDRDVIAFCNSLPPGFKLAGLDEKHILKRVARGVVPDAILDRKKQPYRAPDAVCFVGPHAPDYVRAFLAPEALNQVGVFEPRLVSGLLSKLQRAAEQKEAAVSNADNMALVGILSTQLLHDQLIGRQGKTVDGTASFAVDIDFTTSPHPSQGFHGH